MSSQPNFSDKESKKPVTMVVSSADSSGSSSSTSYSSNSYFERHRGRLAREQRRVLPFGSEKDAVGGGARRALRRAGDARDGRHQGRRRRPRAAQKRGLRPREN